MARRVFFSFHYADVWRAMQVRNAWVVRRDREPAGFVDSADFERIERQGARAIERWIDQQLQGTSMTVVLIGAETARRRYVLYEIAESYFRGNGLLGIRIHHIRDSSARSGVWGPDPFQNVIVADAAGRQRSVTSIQHPAIYDWVTDNGREYIADWIEDALRQAESLP